MGSASLAPLHKPHLQVEFEVEEVVFAFKVAIFVLVERAFFQTCVVVEEVFKRLSVGLVVTEGATFCVGVDESFYGRVGRRPCLWR